jgi:hypothetical protein
MVKPVWRSGNYSELLNAALLIDTITATVEPLSWESRGGPGTIRYYAPLGALIVRQSTEVHPLLRGSLDKFP